MWSYLDGCNILVFHTYKWMVQGSNLSQANTYANVFHDFPQSFQALPKTVPQIRA